MPLMTRSSLLGSWIDVEAATAAAETLCDPLPRELEAGVWAEAAVEAAVEDEPEEEPAREAPPAFLHGRLQALRERAERNGLVPPPPVAGPVPPPFAVPLGSLPVRVRALADWLNESFAPESLFVADDQGQALVEFRGGADLLAAAAVLAEAAAKARRHLPGAAGGAMVHLALGPGQVLSLVSVATALGPWHAGLTTAFPLSEADALDIVRSLQAAAVAA
jgi:hypothetical protein